MWGRHIGSERREGPETSPGPHFTDEKTKSRGSEVTASYYTAACRRARTRAGLSKQSPVQLATRVQGLPL